MACSRRNHELQGKYISNTTPFVSELYMEPTLKLEYQLQDGQELSDLEAEDFYELQMTQYLDGQGIPRDSAYNVSILVYMSRDRSSSKIIKIERYEETAKAYLLHQLIHPKHPV